MATLPVIAYARAGSTDIGTIATARQRERITEWAAQTGHTITEWVEEAGLSHAGLGFVEAVARSRGKLVVAVSPSRISRDPQVLQARIAEVEKAGGRLGFVEGWAETTWQDELASIMIGHETATRNARAADEREAQAPRTVSYRRRSTSPLDEAGPQQQAAAAWEHLDRLGHQVLSVDGAELGRDPEELLDED